MAQKFEFDAATGHITAPGNLCVDGTCANVSSGRCVPLKLTPCSSAVKGQRWTHTPAINTFVNQDNKGCLDNWDSGASKQVGVWKCSGYPGQQWAEVEGGFKVEAKGVPGRCLSNGEGKGNTVHVYSSAASVELVVNGQSLGEKTLAIQERKARQAQSRGLVCASFRS